MAKGLTSGYIPLGAMVVREHIAKTFDKQVLPLGLTYSAHTVSCAAANAVLQVYEDQNLVEAAAKNGQYLDHKMEELMQKHPSFGDWRNTGMLGAIELVKNKETREAMSPWNQGLNEPMSKVAAKIRELGMFTFVKWNLIFVAPPLIATKAELDEGLTILSEAISIADQYCTA
jgi:taurine--2-oxoglutarate transaminase